MCGWKSERFYGFGCFRLIVLKWKGKSGSAISAVCFIGNPQLQSVASRKGVILLSCIFVGFILLLLYREIFVHLSIIYRREKYSAGSSVRNVIEPKDLGMQSDCDDACNWDDKENIYD